MDIHKCKHVQERKLHDHQQLGSNDNGSCNNNNYHTNSQPTEEEEGQRKRNRVTANRQQATGNKPLQLAGHGVGYICVFVMINSCGGGEGRGRTDTLVAS